MTEDAEKVTEREIFDALADIEAAVARLKLYVADVLIRPEGPEGDDGK